MPVHLGDWRSSHQLQRLQYVHAYKHDLFSGYQKLDFLSINIAVGLPVKMVYQYLNVIAIQYDFYFIFKWEKVSFL